MLSQHPRIAFSNPKEPLFFNIEDFENHWDTYYSAFPPPDEQRIFGEGTTFYSEHTTERKTRDAILRYFPDIKLIFVARDPFRRIESSYREFHHSGALFGIHAPVGIDNALAALPALVEDSKYWSRINCYRAKIPDEHILVIFLEDLIRDPSHELKRCFTHLDIESDVSMDILLRLNAGEQKFYDSILLRLMRNNRLIDRLISKVSAEKQNRFFEKIKLRRRFNKPIIWDASSTEYVTENLSQDIHQFLRFYGKPKNYWPRFAMKTSRDCD